MDMRSHVTVLGWLQILLGILDLLMAAALFGLFAAVGVLAGIGGASVLPWVGPAVGTMVGLLVAFTGLPNLLAGFGLLSGKNWARILTLVLAVLNAFKFPWGTGLAVYSFWVLLHDDTRRWFEGAGA